MPIFMPGITSCSICNKLIGSKAAVIGVSPCIPGEVIGEAATLVPLEGEGAFNIQEWYNSRLESWLGWCRYCSESVHKKPFTQEDREKAKAGWYMAKYISPELIKENPIEAMFQILCFHADCLLHKSCYETSPLKVAIDHMRKDSLIVKVNMGTGDIEREDGSTIVSKEKIEQLIEKYS